MQTAFVEGAVRVHAPGLPPADAAPRSRRDYANLIQALTDDGLSATQIARRLGRSRGYVLKVAKEFGVRLQPRGGRRRVSIHLSGAEIERLEILAAQAGKSIGSLLSAGAKLDATNPQAFRKRLGRHAYPKRAYDRRGGR